MVSSHRGSSFKKKAPKKTILGHHELTKLLKGQNLKIERKKLQMEKEKLQSRVQHTYDVGINLDYNCKTTWSWYCERRLTGHSSQHIYVETTRCKRYFQIFIRIFGKVPGPNNGT